MANKDQLKIFRTLFRWIGSPTGSQATVASAIIGLVGVVAIIIATGRLTKHTQVGHSSHDSGRSRSSNFYNTVEGEGGGRIRKQVVENNNIGIAIGDTNSSTISIALPEEEKQPETPTQMFRADFPDANPLSFASSIARASESLRPNIEIYVNVSGALSAIGEGAELNLDSLSVYADNEQRMLKGYLQFLDEFVLLYNSVSRASVMLLRTEPAAYTKLRTLVAQEIPEHDVSMPMLHGYSILGPAAYGLGSNWEGVTTAGSVVGPSTTVLVTSTPGIRRQLFATFASTASGVDSDYRFGGVFSARFSMPNDFNVMAANDELPLDKHHEDLQHFISIVDGLAMGSTLIGMVSVKLEISQSAYDGWDFHGTYICEFRDRSSADRAMSKLSATEWEWPISLEVIDTKVIQIQRYGTRIQGDILFNLDRQ